MKLHALALAGAAALSIGGAQADTVALAGSVGANSPALNRPVFVGSPSAAGTAARDNASEPASYALFLVGLLGMTAWMRKRHQPY